MNTTDTDLPEIQEWLESVDALVATIGAPRADARPRPGCHARSGSRYCAGLTSDHRLHQHDLAR